jgi:hypothetical protein
LLDNASKTTRQRPLLGNGPETATEKRCFLCGPCRHVISRTICEESVIISGYEPLTGLDTKTDTLTDRQSQCDSDSEESVSEELVGELVSEIEECWSVVVKSW